MAVTPSNMSVIPISPLRLIESEITICRCGDLMAVTPSNMIVIPISPLTLIENEIILCRCGEIGRRTRLKIWRGSPHVPVRVRPSANKHPFKRVFFYVRTRTSGSPLSQNDTQSFCSAEWPSANKKPSLCARLFIWYWSVMRNGNKAKKVRLK